MTPCIIETVTGLKCVPLEDYRNLERVLRRERDAAREQSIKLRDIAERAILDLNGCKARKHRAELDQLKEGAK